MDLLITIKLFKVSSLLSLYFKLLFGKILVVTKLELGLGGGSMFKKWMKWHFWKNLVVRYCQPLHKGIFHKKLRFFIEPFYIKPKLCLQCPSSRDVFIKSKSFLHFLISVILVFKRKWTSQLIRHPLCPLVGHLTWKLREHALMSSHRRLTYQLSP